MDQPTPIRILETDSNRRGDLFGRLMADLFVALGYGQPRLNIHKSGRELDLAADHRLEPRRAIAECKATVEPIGGDDLNKFVGALDAEHNDQPQVTGYFISLSGFRETAIEQEKQRRRTKIITRTGPEVIDDLVKGRALVGKERATEIAGGCRAAFNHLVLDPQAEILAHQRGWIWALYYTQGKERTHFVLIHADGTPLAKAVADEIIAADRTCKGVLHKLGCLNPVPPVVDINDRVADALAAYRRYLDSECGSIQLDGMPTDNDVGSRRMRLENLFVPLHLDLIPKKKGKEEPQGIPKQPESQEILELEEAQREEKHQPVGVVLSKHARLALLAAPGGGKSTLIKRLAVAYADPDRRAEIADGLPQRDWFPLFFRCRELRSLARGSFAELLAALSQREGVRHFAAAFRAYVDRALLAGKVLLLVDGLDEISDPGDRAAFVCTLRTALQAYPAIAMVVTSREAGFRHVAVHLAAVCAHATLSPFDHDDIRRLSVAWHREIVGHTEKVRAEAEQLAVTIVQNDRIQRLAVNPLLLTTLLLVKRWLGSLPTRRAALYGEAVKVLLRTWNTEGHDPIPEEEALPQLCYVASAMMLNGAQKVSRPALATLLQEARSALPTELGYVKGSVNEFIQRIEDRSSLLMMTGHDIEDSRLVEFFEFRHLTFQEFLTARAMVEGWHPGRKESDTLAGVLEPQFEKEEWHEVLPLAAVLGGKATEGLLKRLTERCKELPVPEQHDTNGKSPMFLALGDCLADEAAARPEIIRAALRELVRRGRYLENAPFTPLLARGRYGGDLQEEAGQLFLSATKDIGNPGEALKTAVWRRIIESVDLAGLMQATARFHAMLQSSDRLSRCEGALGLMRVSFQFHRSDHRDTSLEFPKSLSEAGASLLPLLFSEELPEQFAAAWAYVWLGRLALWATPGKPDILGRLFMLWRRSTDADIRYFAVWALANQSLMPRDDLERCGSIPRAEFDDLLQAYDSLDDMSEKPSIIIVAWYLRLLNDKDLAERARTLLEKKSKIGIDDPTLSKLLGYLGEESSGYSHKLRKVRLN